MNISAVTAPSGLRKRRVLTEIRRCHARSVRARQSEFFR